MKLLSSQCIWSNEFHNAFTDLCRYRDRFLLCFRSAETHYSADGSIVVLHSGDGREWKLLTRLQQDDTDLRDPKFSLRPDGRLSLNCMAVHYDGEQAVLRQSMLYLFDDAEHWDQGRAIGDPEMWLWRTHWHQDTCYSLGYSCDRDDSFVSLYRSEDGMSFDTWVDRAYSQGYCNEHDMAFDADGNALILLRRDGAKDNTAVLGRSSGELRDWEWQELNIRIGGPALLRLPDGALIAAIRTYGKDTAATELQYLDINTAQLTPGLVLPSGGDTSYAGMVYHQQRLYLSYYSSHEGNTAIYFAEVEY